MNQEDINDVMWNSLPEWRRSQLIEEQRVVMPYQTSFEEYAQSLERKIGIRRYDSVIVGLDHVFKTYSEIWKNAHRDSVKWAIKRGKISKHIEYPEYNL